MRFQKPHPEVAYYNWAYNLVKSRAKSTMYVAHTQNILYKHFWQVLVFTIFNLFTELTHTKSQLKHSKNVITYIIPNFSSTFE